MKKFKCPICGCMEHFPIKFIGEIKKEWIQNRNCPGEWKITKERALFNEDFCIPDGSHSLESSFEVYICKECGHADMFNEHMAKEIDLKIKELMNKKKELKTILKELKKKE